MFWNRAWMETRSRVWYGMGAMVFLVGLFYVIYASGRNGNSTYINYVWNAVVRSGLPMSWPMFSFVVGSVGLIAQCSRVQAAESSVPSLRFLLTLPVERSRLLTPRVVIAMAQMVGLAVFTVMLIALTSWSLGEPYPLDLAAKVLLLLLIAGFPSVGLGVLISIRIVNITRAILTGYGIIFAIVMALVLWGKPLKHPPAFGAALIALACAMVASAVLCLAARRAVVTMEV